MNKSDGTNEKLNVLLAALLAMAAFVAHAEGGNWEDNRDAAWGATLSETLSIGTAEELAQFAWLVNKGEDFTGKTVTLTKRIDLSGRIWTPAGIEDFTLHSPKFSGTFDGQGHTVYGMTIHASNTVWCVGLFGYIKTGGVVRNVTLVDSDIIVFHDNSTQGLFVGGVVGYNYCGTIENCQNNGSVCAMSSVKLVCCGGIAGVNDAASSNVIGIVKNCRNSGEVTSPASGRCFVGGITGLSRGTVADSSNNGDIAAACAGIPFGQSTSCGGVSGHNDRGTIKNCSNRGAVAFSCASSFKDSCGGVVGENYYGSIMNCMSIGAVTSSFYCGGAAGINNGTFGDSYWKADGTAEFNSLAIGISYWSSATSNLFSVNAPPGQFAAPHPAYGTTSLLDALNGWVDATNAVLGAEVYRHWTLEGSPDGYPILDFTQSTYTEGGNWEDNRDTAWGAALSETLHIGTAEELAQFAWLVNTTGNDFFSGVTVVLTSDIDLSAHGWTPAGTNNPARIFHGTFDGQGHTIYGMTIHASNTVTYAGLFGTIGEGSMVCNVNLVDTDIAIYCDREDIRAGGIVGVNVRGTVANCRNSGTVSCLFSRPPYYTHCGGIVGYNAGRVKDCVNSAAVSAASTSSATIGGVVGLNDYRVVTENCQNRGAVSSACHQYTHCGGVVGWNRGVAANCWSSGNVTASVSNYTTYLGGVIGENGVLGFPSGNLARDSYWKADGTAGFNRAAAGVNYGYSSNLFSVNAPPGQFASSHPTYGTTSLLDALNGWVDATNAVLGAEVYRLWTLDGSPDGYPILFSEPPTPPYSYAVAFVSTALDGGGVMYNQPFTNGVAQNLNLNAFRFPCTALPVPTEFPFLGWAASAGGDVVFTDGQNVCDLTGTPDATVTLYTVWGSVTDDASGITANPDGSVVTGDGAVSSDGSMTVTLDPAGGVCETSVVCTDFTYNALPEDVDRPGYTFLGWVTRTGQPVVNGMRFLDANYAAALTAQWVSATAPEIAGVDAPPPTVGVTYLGQVVMRPSSMPSKLSAQKLPTGLKLNPSTGEITGVPKKVGIHTVTVRATSLSNRKAYTEQTFRMVVAPLPAGAIGTFDGYLDGTDDHGPVNLGSLTLTASASGKASAKVVAAASGAQSVSIPAWDSLSNGVLRATAVSAKGIPLTVALDTTAAFGSWQLTGAFGDTPALAQRNALKVKEDPHFAAAQEALAAHMGYYTVGIRGDCILDGHGPLLFPPRGFGYLSLTVGTKPSLKLAGRLADGKAFSGTCPIAFGAGNVLVPYFFPLYAAQGYHSGVLELTPALTASGEGRWVYPGLSPAAKVPLTADRFTLSILLAGGAYTPAAAALATYPQGPFFKAGPTDADYTYTKGKYSVTASPLPPPQDGVVMVGDKKGNLTLPTGTVPVYDPVASAYIFDHWNPAQATFNVTPATGLFKGKFNVYYEYPDEGGASRLKAIPVSYQGILTPLAGWGAGVGHSLLGDTRIDASGAKPVTYKLMRSEPVTLEVE